MCPTLFIHPHQKINYNNTNGKNRKRRRQQQEAAVCGAGWLRPRRYAESLQKVLGTEGMRGASFPHQAWALGGQSLLSRGLLRYKLSA